MQPASSSSALWLLSVHRAARAGAVSVLRVLRVLGLDLTAMDGPDAAQPIHHAAANGQTAVVAFLVDECGVSAAAATSEGWQPVHFAAAGGFLPTVRWLCAHSSRLSDAVAAPALLTPLHCAALAGQLHCCRYLVEEAACDPRRRTADGFSALHLSAAAGQLAVSSFLLRLPPPLIALRVDCLDRQLQTPLIAAARRGQLAVCRLLRECGAALEAEDSSGVDALTAACLSRSEACMRWARDERERSRAARLSASDWLRVLQRIEAEASRQLRPHGDEAAEDGDDKGGSSGSLDSAERQRLATSWGAAIQLVKRWKEESGGGEGGSAAAEERRAADEGGGAGAAAQAELSIALHTADSILYCSCTQLYSASAGRQAIARDAVRHIAQPDGESRQLRALLALLPCPLLRWRCLQLRAQRVGLVRMLRRPEPEHRQSLRSRRLTLSDSGREGLEKGGQVQQGLLQLRVRLQRLLPAASPPPPPPATAAAGFAVRQQGSPEADLTVGGCAEPEVHQPPSGVQPVRCVAQADHCRAVRRLQRQRGRRRAEEGRQARQEEAAAAQPDQQRPRGGGQRHALREGRVSCHSARLRLCGQQLSQVDRAADFHAVRTAQLQHIVEARAQHRQAAGSAGGEGEGGRGRRAAEGCSAQQLHSGADLQPAAAGRARGGRQCRCRRCSQARAVPLTLLCGRGLMPRQRNAEGSAASQRGEETQRQREAATRSRRWLAKRGEAALEPAAASPRSAPPSCPPRRIRHVNQRPLQTARDRGREGHR